uniref:substrate binding domain-containing protein n=1 Tax=Thaumasiovibrio occultus TaxID=1891184 RepID=UPI00131B053A|nr:substrate binding domain-containing protein [Thaumasiovibrio occultus]
MEHSGVPRGKLRISLSSVLGELATADMLARFRSLYPNIDLDILVDDRFVDLVEEGFDLRIRASSAMPDSSMTYRNIGNIPVSLVASTTYLNRNGRPESVEGLEKHQMIAHRYSTNFTKGQQIERVTIHCCARANSTQLVYGLVVRHQGIAFLPHHIFADDPTIERLLPEYDRGSLTLSIVYPARDHTPLKVHNFINFFKEWFGEAFGVKPQ